MFLKICNFCCETAITQISAGIIMQVVAAKCTYSCTCRYSMNYTHKHTFVFIPRWDFTSSFPGVLVLTLTTTYLTLTQPTCNLKPSRHCKIRWLWLWPTSGPHEEGNVSTVWVCKQDLVPTAWVIHGMHTHTCIQFKVAVVSIWLWPMSWAKCVWLTAFKTG